jgi:hypothetical protein
MIDFSKKLGATVGLAFIVMLVGTTQLVNAQSGLRVFVYVHKPTANFANGQEADVTVNTSDDYDKFKTVTVPNGHETFYVEFEYGPNQVDVGDEIAGCVRVGGLFRCASTWNGEEKEPERIDIYLHRESSDSSSSASSSDSSSSSSSSSSSQAKICLIC